MTIDQLAQIIRQVDGDHLLGAATLAEAIMGHPDFQEAFCPSPPDDRFTRRPPYKETIPLPDIDREQLRDEFAKAAMNGILSDPMRPRVPEPDLLAKLAYEIADAMLIARDAE